MMMTDRQIAVTCPECGGLGKFKIMVNQVSLPPYGGMTLTVSAVPDVPHLCGGRSSEW